MKWIDMPPVWLFACLVLAWGVPLRFAPGVLAYPGWLALGLGGLLMGLAVVEFLRARTTIIPRESPDALISGGIYRLTRNPIYLADALILLGASLLWGSIVGLILVPVFMVVIERRFIRAEEAILRQAFPDAFARYAEDTRRWF